MADEHNTQDMSTPTDLETRSLRPPDSITPNLDPKAFNYTVAPISLASAAFTDQEWEIQGEKIYYMEGQSRLRIKLDSNRNDYIDLYPGRKIVAPFKRFFVTAPIAEEVVKLVISSPYWVSVHGEGVEVNTLIKSKEQFRETELGRAYIGGGMMTGVAAEYSSVQLWNPTDTGVIAIVRSIAVESDSTYEYIRWDVAAHTTNLVDTGNKYIGLLRPNCEVRRASAGVQFGTSLAHLSDIILGNTHGVLEGYDDAIIILPGYGINVTSGSVEKYIRVCYQWLELPEDDISSFLPRPATIAI